MTENNKNDAKNIEKMMKKLDREIQCYRQALEDAGGALAEAESELDEVLAEPEKNEKGTNQEKGLGQGNRTECGDRTSEGGVMASYGSAK